MDSSFKSNESINAPASAPDELPDPQPDRTGWPWTKEGGTLLSEVMSDGQPWPLISIVTPSYNQGQFIEETIRSVLLQGYPNLEYIVIDGKSTDESVDIIKRYAPWIDHWESKLDRGQSHAINKGFERARGTIYGWLNSDDLFRPDALMHVAQVWHTHSEAVAWVGSCEEVEADRTPIRKIEPRGLTKREMGHWWEEGRFFQPSCLFDAQTFHAVDGLNESLHYAMDIDLWLRMSERGTFVTVPHLLSEARMYEGIKTWSSRERVEAEKIALNVYNDQLDVAEKHLRRFVRKAVKEHERQSTFADLVKLFFDRLKRKTRNAAKRLLSQFADQVRG